MLHADSGKSLKEILLEAKDFTAKDMDILARALNASDSAQHFEEALGKLAILALMELADWITASKRFGSIAELDASRIMNIFLDIRRDMPAVEKVVDQFAIPEARAVSMLARMRYGEARKLRAAYYSTYGKDLAELVAAAKEEEGLKYLDVEKGLLDAIEEAWWHLMKTTDQAERPKVLWKNKYGGRVAATPPMWDHIVKWLVQKHQELSHA